MRLTARTIAVGAIASLGALILGTVPVAATVVGPPAGRAGAAAPASAASATTIAVPITCEPYDHSNPDLWVHTIDHLEVSATAPASVPFGGTFPMSAVGYTAAYDQPESGLTVGTMLFLTSSAQTAASPAPFPFYYAIQYNYPALRLV